MNIKQLIKSAPTLSHVEADSPTISNYTHVNLLFTNSHRLAQFYTETSLLQCLLMIDNALFRI